VEIIDNKWAKWGVQRIGGCLDEPSYLAPENVNVLLVDASSDNPAWLPGDEEPQAGKGGNEVLTQLIPGRDECFLVIAQAIENFLLLLIEFNIRPKQLAEGEGVDNGLATYQDSFSALRGFEQLHIPRLRETQKLQCGNHELRPPHM
jgi:hypothetical protein